MRLSEITRWKREKVEFNPLEKLERWVDKGCFFTMTEINKLGINPHSTYDTPLGIYSYPLTSKFYALLLKAQLPFANDADFVQIFRPKSGANVLTLGFNEQKFDELCELVENEVKGSSGENFYNKVYEKAIETASGKTFSTIFWNLTRLVAKQSPIKWRSLFLSLGIDGVNDPGRGVIHQNEPEQAVFFNTEAIEHLDTLDNPSLMNTRSEQILMKDVIKMANSGKIGWLVRNVGKLVGKGDFYTLKEVLGYIRPNVILQMMQHPQFNATMKEFVEYAEVCLLTPSLHDTVQPKYVTDDFIKLFVHSMVDVGRIDELKNLSDIFNKRYTKGYAAVFKNKSGDIAKKVIETIKELVPS
jgi:hypothetical protein